LKETAFDKNLCMVRNHFRKDRLHDGIPYRNIYERSEHTLECADLSVGGAETSGGQVWQQNHRGGAVTHIQVVIPISTSTTMYSSKTDQQNTAHVLIHPAHIRAIRRGWYDCAHV